VRKVIHKKSNDNSGEEENEGNCQTLTNEEGKDQSICDDRTNPKILE
jgi:hypothetical protein